MDDAACEGYVVKPGEKDIFFPGRGETNEEAVTGYCIFCTVREECKDFADRRGIKVGVWGGERRTRATHGTESERRK